MVGKNGVNILSVNVNFEKKNAIIDLEFDNYHKIYTYNRKFTQEGLGHISFVINGIKFYYDLPTSKVYEEEVIYSTKGVKRTRGGGKNKYKQKEEKLDNKPQEEKQDDDGWGPLDLTTQEKRKKLLDDVKEELGKKVEIVDYSKIKHEKYNQIKLCLQNDIPVYLSGPAGSGKNYTVEEIAKELGWNFYFSNSVQQEYKLTGFIDAGGDYHETEFYKACTDGDDCIFFLDEMDASIPDVLVLLNAAIANGYFEFPTGRVDFENVHFVAAGNTVGNGADDMYTGRMVIDSATLDRFAIIEFDYDYNVEMKITNENKDLVDFIHDLRNVSNKNGIRSTFSLRCMIMVTKLENTDMDLQDILKITVLKGLDKDTINTLITDYTKYSKYHTSLRSIQATI